MRVIGCGRASKSDQELTLVAQRRRLEAACAERDWQLVEYVEDQQGRGLTGKGLAHAIEEVRKRADVLMIAKLDRLPRSVASITGLMEQAHRERWKLLILDHVDMTTPYGRAMAQMAAVFAELERALISARTKGRARRAESDRRRPGVVRVESRQHVHEARAAGTDTAPSRRADQATARPRLLAATRRGRAQRRAGADRPRRPVDARHDPPRPRTRLTQGQRARITAAASRGGTAFPTCENCFVREPWNG
jgi:DNA invertase Pin-like site-specific DNA recombinase